MHTELVAQKPAIAAIDRRRFPRHRLSTPVTVWQSDQSRVAAMTIEISDSGLSICTGAPLTIGDKVDLEPIGGGRVTGIVQWKLGKVYGLEFLALGTKQLVAIRRICGRLPLFRSGATGI